MSSRAAYRLLGVLLLAGCSARPDIANLDSTGTTVICFGDSLTAGATPGHDYPNLLAETLGREVINAGVSGDTTQDGVRRLATDVLARTPRLVIVEFGGNDFLRQVPRQQTFANLDRMVEEIQAHGAMVVLVGVPAGLLWDDVQKDYEKIARARRAAFVPNILGGILTQPSLKSDELHPNDRGYEQIARRILRVIKPLLEPAS